MRVKDINIKYRMHYFFNNIIYIENIDPNNIKMKMKSYTKIFLFTMLDM